MRFSYEETVKSTSEQNWVRLIGLLLLLGIVSFLIIGCRSNEPTPVDAAIPTPSFARSQIIVLGDVDPNEPAKKVKRFRSLAGYLAQNLHEFGILKGRVLIAQTVEEMAVFLETGMVDVYFDSSFPALVAEELSGSQIILRRWKDAHPDYWSLFVALKDSDLDTVQGFVGKVLAFDKPSSTSGFVLPAGTLVQRGFTVKEVDGLIAPVAADEIGYYFSGDEENTIQLILQGKVAGGGISNQDYDALPLEIKARLIALDRTVAVPRQLVSVRPGMDPEMVEKVRRLLVSLDRSDEGKKLLFELKKTRKFDMLPPNSKASLEELKKLMDLVFND